MESNKLCSQQNYVYPRNGRQGSTYSKLQKYTTPLCKPFKQTVFLDEEQPNFETSQNMCRKNNECKDDNVYTYLNKRGVEQSPYFVQEKDGKYISKKPDGRMIDSSRSYQQELDIKPIQVVYNLIHDNVSGNPELKDYGKNYKNYSTVTGGQIQYYIDKDEEAFNSPVYAAKTKATGIMYKDPMDSIKPQFDKQYPTESFTGLSWLDDSCSFRDDIISKQQRVNNQRRYELMYNRD